MTTNRTAPAAALASALLGLVLAGCTAGGSTDDTKLPPEASLRLHPHGDAGQWLDPVYAKGIGSQYVTMNEVCAVTRELVVEVQRGPMGEPTVMARSLQGGGVHWQLEDSDCRPGALLPADPQATEARARSNSVVVRTGEEWRLLDPVSGVERGQLPAEKDTAGVAGIEPLAWAGSLLVVQSGSELVGIDGQKEAWRLSIPARAEVTVLADGHAGITDFQGSQVSVVDLETGKTTMSTAVPDAHWITWASDGYVQKVQETDPEYAFFDLEGREVDRTKGVSQYRFVPGPAQGVTLPVADHRRAGTVVGVSGQGVPALFADERQRDFTRAGAVEELPDSIISLQGVSLDGSLLMFDRDPEGLTILDDEGSEVAAWPLPTGEQSIESGRIVIRGDSGTWVLLPSPH